MGAGLDASGRPTGAVAVLFERLVDGARVPTRATEGSAGYDLYSAESGFVYPREMHKFRTGFKIQAPRGWCIIGIPRSGMCLKGITFANCVGLIDSDYGGEMHVMLANHGKDVYKVEAGDRIGQILVIPAWAIDFKEVGAGEVDGRGGLGSTGR